MDPATPEFYTYAHTLSLHDALPISDDRPHPVLRRHGGDDPPGLGDAVDLRDRLLPQLLRPDRTAAVPVAQRAGGAAHAAVAALPGAQRDRRGLDAVRLLGDREPADGAGDLAGLLGAAVRHHRRGDLPAG